MSTGKKILIGVLTTPLILMLLLLLLWDANWFKNSVTPHIEDVENHSIQFETIEHSLFNPGKITIRDVTIQGPIAAGKIDNMVVSINVMKAIDKDILVNEITLLQPDLQIDIAALNAFLAEPKPATEEKPAEGDIILPVRSVFIHQASIKNASIRDISTLQQFAIQGLNLTLSDINVAQNSKVVLLQENAPINARLNIDSLEAQSMPPARLDTEITATRQNIQLKSLLADTGKSQLDINANLKNINEHADIQLTINPSKLSAEEFHAFIQDIPVKPFGDFELEGNMATSGQLSDSEALLNALTGNVSLGLRQGKVQGININKVVAAFKNSKETDMKDIGGFLLTGPVGILAANMFDLSGGADTLEGETQIPQLKINGHVERGNISFSDTAIATDQYRLAFDGAINPLTSTFNDFTFALLNEAGCAALIQTLNGDMAEPTSAVARSLLDSAIAPVTGILKALQNTVSDCEPFYEGEVAHPNVDE